MADIKILDCTLRDGGYNNNWAFGFDTIQCIMSRLCSANIDFIECGFLCNRIYDKNYSLFSDIPSFTEIINGCTKSKFCLMVNFREFDIKNFPLQNSENLFIRIAFNKNDLQETIKYSKELQQRGFKIFINPKNFSSFEEDEIMRMLDTINTLSPYAFSIVDTIGALKPDDINKNFRLINRNLENNISVCFHSHNNLELSFENTLELIKIRENRNLIIDSSLYGMGRGAGNLKTEDITKFLNEYSGKNYNSGLLEEAVDSCIKPIYEKPSFDNLEMYKLCAQYNCHPNYAKFLLDKNIKGNFKQIFEQIPRKEKFTFNKMLIKELINVQVC